MSPTLTRWLVAATATGALAATVCWTDGLEAIAQPAKGDMTRESGEAGVSQRILNCRRCHFNPLPEDREAKTTEFIKLTEFPTWHDDDLHSQAYANIRLDDASGKGQGTGLAARMQAALVGHRPAGYRVDRAVECLACHAVDLTLNRESPVPASAKKASDFDTASGVTCEACHGLVTDAWIGQHSQRSWRDKTPNEKRAANQIDLRDPYTRALQCAACHVGDKEHGKFVTHEMYAAGHPPLPPFEVVTFARDAPRHYYTHRQNKALAAMPADQAWHNFHYRAPATKDKPDGECPEARALALGSVATFEATMNLLAKDAADTPKDQLLDFAHFDCYACHHDLKVPSWRQARGYRGTPGRPTMKPWSTEVLQAVMDHAKGASGFKTEEATKATEQVRQSLAALNKQFDARPFGDAAEIAKEAKAFGLPCQALRTALSDDAAVYTTAQTEALYRLLADRLTKEDTKPGADGLYLDHDAAQQAVWALNALRAELRAARGEPEMEATPAATALNAITELHVRSAKREPVAPERLKTRLDHIAAFDPGMFLPKAREWIKEK